MVGFTETPNKSSLTFYPDQLCVELEWVYNLTDFLLKETLDVYNRKIFRFLYSV